MKYLMIVNVFVLLSLFSSLVGAREQDIEQIRQDYLDVEHLARYGSGKDYLSQFYKIQDYPLAPYAEAIFLENNLSLKNKKRIQTLLAQYPKAPFSYGLRKAWLTYLAKRQLRQAFIEEYVDVADVKLR